MPGDFRMTETPGHVILITMIRSMFKKADLILLIVLVAGGILASLTVARAGGTGSSVVIKVNGSLYGTYDLNKDQEITVRSGAGKDGADSGDMSGYNIVRIKDGKVSVTDADCHNHDCMHHKPISRSGESIICLPHKVVVGISSEEGGEGYDTIAQ